MALTSPAANLYELILERIALKAPGIRYIEQDLGQLDNYELRPAVSWPCALIDIEDGDFNDVATDFGQTVQLTISIRIGLVKYTDSNNITPKNIRAHALQYFEHEQAVYLALHGWGDAGFSRMLRRSASTEKRTDDIRVRVLKFVCSYTDTSAAPARTVVPRPKAVIGVTKP
jgi:hypothetical protein